ncbi:hypothetical protein PLESTB_000632800 [Pleodorina starrii]|uniref:Uncharacterized protein n=1 Tax=Pleodorina starrii TaxID=330485 RepID=A0A9W6BHW6_9CHLO|nr:hypothetical protein PLESTB_000632800 [Pleodorina starrii]GLC69718.1 hypothetical protein PLESTF_000869800 [Pleodorina starrii]
MVEQEICNQADVFIGTRSSTVTGIVLERAVPESAITRAVNSREINVGTPSEAELSKFKDWATRSMQEQAHSDHEIVSRLLLHFRTGLMSINGVHSTQRVEHVRLLSSGIALVGKKGDAQGDLRSLLNMGDKFVIYEHEKTAQKALEQLVEQNLNAGMFKRLEFFSTKTGTKSYEMANNIQAMDATLGISLPIDLAHDVLSVLEKLHMPTLVNTHQGMSIEMQPLNPKIRVGLGAGKKNTATAVQEPQPSSHTSAVDCSSLCLLTPNSYPVRDGVEVLQALAVDLVLGVVKDSIERGLNVTATKSALTTVLSSTVASLLDISVRSPRTLTQEMREQLADMKEHGRHGGMPGLPGATNGRQRQDLDLAASPMCELRVTAAYDQHAIILQGLSRDSTLKEIRAAAEAARQKCQDSLRAVVVKTLSKAAEQGIRPAIAAIKAIESEDTPTHPYVMSTRGRVGPFLQLTGEALDEYILIGTESGTLAPLLNYPPDACDTSTLAQPEDMKYYLAKGTIAIAGSSRLSAGFLSLGLTYNGELDLDPVLQANGRSLYISLPPNSSVTACTTWFTACPINVTTEPTLSHPRGLLAASLSAILGLPARSLMQSEFLSAKDAATFVRSLAFATKSVIKPADEHLRDLSPVAAPEVQFESDSLTTLLDRTGIDWSILSNEGDDVMRALLGDLDDVAAMDEEADAEGNHQDGRQREAGCKRGRHEAA